jgi:hypothetical protein
LSYRRAARHRHRGQSSGGGVVEQHAAPDIAWVAKLGAAAVDTGAPPKPLYLRAPDAQPQNASQLARR